MRSEWGALKAALALAMVAAVLAVGGAWMLRQKQPDFRVGLRVALAPRGTTQGLPGRAPTPVPRVGLGGETRSAWRVSAGSVLRLSLQVPGEDPVLRFREGYLQGLPDLSVTLVRADGRRETLLSDHATREAWGLRRVPLPARVGAAIDLEIACLDGEGRPGLGQLYVADPVLESEGRPVDVTEVPLLLRETVSDLLAAYGGERVAAPPTPQGAPAGLPGPECMPLPPGVTRRLPWDPPRDTEAGRLELVLHAGPRGPEGRAPAVAVGEVQILDGERVLARVGLDFVTAGVAEVAVTLDLPLTATPPSELGFRRVGDPGLFVGLREAVVSAPRRVWRRVAEPGGAPNVLLVIADSIRPERLGAWGHERAVTPALDGLAARGGRWVRVLAPSSWTLPNVTSLLTGTSPVTHGLGMAPHRVLSRRLGTLAEAAAAAGYSTAAFSSNGWLSEEQGLDQGQDVFALRVVPAPIVVESALDWLTEVADFQWFLTLHLSDATYPHEPEDRDLTAVGRAVDPELVARLRDLDSRPGMAETLATELGPYYDAEVAGVDRAIGDVLAWLEARGTLDDTLVVFVGSQGEEFFEHGGRLHGRTLYDEVVSVPLVAAGPGVPGAFVESTPIELVDVTRLVAHLAGLETGLESGGVLQGRLPPPFGDRPEAPPVAHALLEPFADVVQARLGAVREGDHLLLLDRLRGRRALYDTGPDGDGRLDLLTQEPSHALRVTADRLERSWHEWYRAGLRAAAPHPVRWPAVREELRP